jgi:hypothetical protein
VLKILFRESYDKIKYVANDTSKVTILGMTETNKSTLRKIAVLAATSMNVCCCTLQVVGLFPTFGRSLLLPSPY